MQLLTPESVGVSQAMHIHAHPKVQTVKTLCALKCDVNKTAMEEDIAGGVTADPAVSERCLQLSGIVESANLAQCQHPCNLAIVDDHSILFKAVGDYIYLPVSCKYLRVS